MHLCWRAGRADLDKEADVTVEGLMCPGVTTICHQSGPRVKHRPPSGHFLCRPHELGDLCTQVTNLKENRHVHRQATLASSPDL